jgi:hypothetical protein
MNESRTIKMKKRKETTKKHIIKFMQPSLYD